MNLIIMKTSLTFSVLFFAFNFSNLNKFHKQISLADWRKSIPMVKTVDGLSNLAKVWVLFECICEREFSTNSMSQ